MYCPTFLNVNFKNVQLAGLNLVEKSLLLFQETYRGILTSTGKVYADTWHACLYTLSSLFFLQR